MHPASTALFLLGYGLALPIGMRLSQMVSQQNRLGLVGHQAGVILAMLGWILRGSIALALFHLAWLAVARIWFETAARRASA